MKTYIIRGDTSGRGPTYGTGYAKEFLQFDLLFVRRNGGAYCALRLHQGPK